jgi:hypothetical protein
VILLSDVETARRQAGIDVRARERAGQVAGFCAGRPDRLEETSDLPFLFQAYGIERPLRRWLERLYVAGFAHGHALRIALLESPAAIDRVCEEDAIEACLVRWWLRPVAYAPREATTIAYGAIPAYWSCWTFEPAGDLSAWLGGGGLPVIGDPLRQAEYDGQTAGMRFRALEQAAHDRELETALWDAYVDVQESAARGEGVPDAVLDGVGEWCVPWEPVLTQLRSSWRWSEVSEAEALRASERLDRRGVTQNPVARQPEQMSLMGGAR